MKPGWLWRCFEYGLAAGFLGLLFWLVADLATHAISAFEGCQ